MRSSFLFSVALLLVLPGGVFAQAERPDCEAERCAAQAAISQQCPCAEATNHGRFVSCVAHVVKEHVSPGCRGKAIRCAARSTCGKPGFVTCERPSQTCAADFGCGTRCSIKSSAERCTDAGGQVGASSSCCRACS